MKEYTVQQVARLSGVTVKTLHHYQKVGLLKPHRRGENGYRYYTEKELERLQEILVYREMDMPLSDIKLALESQPDRLRCLCRQQQLLFARRQRLDGILHTVTTTIEHMRKGEPMAEQKLFEGLDARQWETVMEQQNEHLDKTYGVTIPVESLDATELNEKAEEASRFLHFMADSLKEGIPASDARVQAAITGHVDYLSRERALTLRDFCNQNRFFLEDAFHRSMLESMQTGLSYYLYTSSMYAAEFAEA